MGFMKPAKRTVLEKVVRPPQWAEGTSSEQGPSAPRPSSLPCPHQEAQFPAEVRAGPMSEVTLLIGSLLQLPSRVIHTHWDSHYRQNIFKKENYKAGGDVEKLEPSCVAGET